MNANELADELETGLNEGAWVDPKRIQAAAMLRQLQAENEALKRPNNVVGVPQDKLVDMQATIRQLQAENEALKGEVAQLKHINKNSQISENILLLELEKLQQRELTDEEILQQAEWTFGTHFFECIDDPYWIEFAKAILRKAQEK